VVTAPDQFSVDGDTLQLWAAAGRFGHETLPDVRTTIVYGDGRILAVNGGPHRVRPTILSTVGDLESGRTPVELAALSPWVVPAVLAMEDAHFFTHVGVDLEGTARAARATLSGQSLQGGSTLTQQLAKNLFVGNERSLERKVREAFTAVALERRLDKLEILELYLNELYLGHVAGRPVYGIDQGARGFFATSPEHLSLAQSAVLAGIISSPNPFSPVRHPERALERRNIALRRMQDLGFISAVEAEHARDEPLNVQATLPLAGRRVPWVVDGAVETVQARGHERVDGLAIHTFIQPDWQRIAEKAIADGYADLIRTYPATRGAQLALTAVRVSDGAVVALVGGRDASASTFDRASDGYRQLGSTVKPLTLLAAMTHDGRLLPTSPLNDAPIERNGWRPRNYDGRYQGRVTVRHAIESSRNIPAVLLAERVGPEGLQQFYQRVGLSQATAWPSAALGAFPGTTLEIAGAYTVFPGRGIAVRPRLVGAIADGSGRVIDEVPVTSTGVATARAAALATSILQGVVDRGTGQRVRRLGVEGPVGGKTGTTDDWRDAWFVGFTPNLVVAVWVGHDREHGIALTGSRAALPTWVRFIQGIGGPTGTFPTDTGLEYVPVCNASHQIARSDCPSTYQELLPRHYGGAGMCDTHNPFLRWEPDGIRPTDWEPDRSVDDTLLEAMLVTPTP
jgi:penicillin-binding protein 1B